MKLQELIGLVDLEDIVRIYGKRWDFHPEPPPSPEQIRIAYEELIAELTSCDPEPSDDIILPIVFTEEGEGRLCAELFKLEDVKAFVPSFTDGQLDELAKNAPAMSKDELMESLHEMERPPGYAYDFSPWEEIVGCEVFVEGADEETRAAIVEDALWELSFFGVNREEHDKRVDEMLDKLEEAQKDIEAGNYITHDEMKQNLFDRFGYVDERTEEEKDEALRLLLLDSVLSAVSSSKMLAACAKSLCA